MQSTDHKDLSELNFEYLTIARDMSKNNPLQALWVFNISEEQATRLAQLSIAQMREISRCGRSLMSLDWF